MSRYHMQWDPLELEWQLIDLLLEQLVARGTYHRVLKYKQLKEGCIANQFGKRVR